MNEVLQRREIWDHKTSISSTRVIEIPLHSYETIGKPRVSPLLPQYLDCNTVFDMRLRVTFLRRKTVPLQSNIAHGE
jgi:hypothetical protein